MTIIDAESEEVPVGTTAALVPLASSSVVRPAAALADIREAFQDYQALCASLLVADDYQQIGDKQFRKKSAWRKLAVAFNVSCEVVSRDYERNDAGRIVRAEVVVRALAPNGRYMEGLGACDIFERCCSTPCPKTRWQKHKCCESDCNGSHHFSKPQHDIPATAMTRATNRACADLFGMGEVSAEEVMEPPSSDALCPICGDVVPGAADDKEPLRAHLVTVHDHVRQEDGTVKKPAADDPQRPFDTGDAA